MWQIRYDPCIARNTTDAGAISMNGNDDPWHSPRGNSLGGNSVSSRVPASREILGQARRAEATWKGKNAKEDFHGEYDPSRIPPRIFIRRAEARSRNEKEIRDPPTLLQTAFRN